MIEHGHYLLARRHASHHDAPITATRYNGGDIDAFLGGRDIGL